MRKRGDNMPLVKILEDYGAAEQYKIGDVVDISDPSTLVAEGKVEYVTQPKTPKVKPVAAPTTPTEGSVIEGADEPNPLGQVTQPAKGKK